MSLVITPAYRPRGPVDSGKLRVGLLCHRGVGGSVRVAIELAGALARAGRDVHLFARSAPLGMAAPAGVTLHTLHKGSFPEAVTSHLDLEWSYAELDDLTRRVIRVALEAQLDVLHFHYAVPFAWVLERVGRTLGANAPALVGTLHGTDVSVFGTRQGRTRDTLAAALAQLDAITTVSRNHAALAARVFCLAAPPHVIPNFVDAQKFCPVAREPSERGRPAIIHVSNLRAIKHPQSMARVFVAVRRQLDAELWVLGDGEAMAAVRQHFDHAGLLPDVKLFGLRTDTENILRHAAVLLVTSRTESFCLAALEAAACGVPVVAPRVGGLPEVVAHGHTGILFEPGDERGAASAIVRLLSDTALWVRTGSAAVAHASRFAIGAIVPRYEQVYRQAVAARRGTTIVPKTTVLG